MARKGHKLTVDKFHKISLLGSEEERRPLLLDQGPPPADTCLFAYLILYLQGIGHLLPWNFFITANEYFKSKFTCQDVANSTCYGFKDSFENYFSVASMLPIFVMGGVNIWLQSKVHYKYRMVLALVVMLMLFVVTTAFVGIQTSSWVDAFFAVTLITVIVINMASSVFQSSTFGFAGVLPMQYTSIVMSGQACAGIFAALVNIIFTAAATDTTDSTLGYFSTAVAVILLCLISFLPLIRLRFVQYYLAQTSVKTQKAKQEAAVRASVNVKALNTSPPFIRIFCKIWLYAVSVFLVFAVTLSLFPAVLSHIKSTSPHPKRSPWTGTYFTPLVCFLLFNVSDFVGRFITHWIMFGKNPYVLLLLSTLRVTFVPLFLLCNVWVAEERTIPLVFNCDVFPVVFNLLFGLSNGYLGSVAMVAAPQSVPSDQRETASTIMAFFLSGGLLVGGSISFLWTKVVAW